MSSFLRKFYKIFSRNDKNWLEKVNMEELEIEKRKLELQGARVAKEVAKLEKEKNGLFNEGVGKDFLVKRMIARDIQELDVEAKHRVKDFDSIHMMRRATFNLLMTLKRRERLKGMGLWQKIRGYTPDQLLTLLARLEAEEEEFEDKLLQLIGAEKQIAEMEELDPATQEIMDLWAKVEQKEMAPEEVAKRLSVEESLKEKEPV